MTWVDWCIAAIFGYFIFKGFKLGFVQQLFELLGSVAALIIASHIYHKVGTVLAAQLHFSRALSNIIAFILIVVLISGGVALIGKHWHASRKNQPIALFDGGFGALFGSAKAALIIMIGLLILLALPMEFIHGPIETSEFANDILRLTPVLVMMQDRAIPADFPRMVISSEGLKWRSIDYQKLKFATCFVCGSKTEYHGLVKKGLLYYPVVVCPQCHRKSDGCLTFEGHHMIHHECPYERLGSLGTTDCKIWPNIEPATVKGKCPVCGRTQ